MWWVCGGLKDVDGFVVDLWDVGSGFGGVWVGLWG